MIYHIVLFIYKLSVRVLSPFNSKAGSMFAGKKRWKIEPTTKPTFWMHCASLGEFEQGRPVLEAFKKKYPEWDIVLTFFSPTGIEHTKSYRIADAITYLPWDSKNNALEFYDIVKPKLVCFVKYEFWYHLLSEGKRRGIPIILISGIFRPNQPFFKWYGKFYTSILTNFTSILVQNRASKLLLEEIEVQSEVCGDSRIDRVLEIGSNMPSFDFLEGVSKKIFIVGSGWPDDMEVVLPVINSKNDLVN